MLINQFVPETSLVLDTIKTSYFPQKDYPINYQGTTDGGNMIEGSIYGTSIEVQRLTYWETRKTKIRTKAAGVWSGWIDYVTNSDMLYKNQLLTWGDYADGTYTLIDGISRKQIAISIGINGRIKGYWTSSIVGDIRTLVFPGGAVNVTILSDTQVQITGTTADYRVRDIGAM